MPRIQGSSQNGSYLYVDYSFSSGNVAENYTDVSWVAGVHWGNYYFNIHDARVTMSTTVGSGVGGTTTTGFYNSGWPISGAGTNRDHPFRSGFTRVYHNNLGQGNIKFVGSAWWDTPSNFTSNLNATLGLPDIPRFTGPPSTPTISNINSTSVDVSFSDGSGGAPIDSRQIAYGVTTSVDAAAQLSSDGSTTIIGLTPGTTYYFWARTHNVAGYSAWSGMASATTLRVPDAPAQPVISDVTQISAVVSFNTPANGGTPITMYQVDYSSDGFSSTPSSIVPANSQQSVTGLVPATTYSFRVRARNAVGWGPYSLVTIRKTVAGARVKVGGIWKDAVPYVRHDGTWKLARPWVREIGVWRETL